MYNTGPITSISDSTWNRKQFYSLTRVDSGGTHVLADNLACPPCRIGPLSTSDYEALAQEAVHALPGGGSVFAGQRADGFYVDLGAIFDLGILRPLASAHTTFGLPGVSLASGPGVNTLKASNVHSIAIQVPIRDLTRNGSIPKDPTNAAATIGVWTTASRQKVSIRGHGNDGDLDNGPFVQVSRLGNPLVNEVLIPMPKKDFWNRQIPADDHQFLTYVAHPQLADLLPVLYPGAFPHLASLDSSKAPRDDLVAILLTGIPAGVVSKTFSTYTGPTQADMLRLNVAIPPSKTPSNLGVLGGDLAGYPNGRRVFDDVVTIALQAVAGATYPLVMPKYTPDAVVKDVTDGLTSGPSDLSAKNTEHYLSFFPYLGYPHSGYTTPDH